MGKARIISAQGDGLYSIEVLEDRTRAESRKVRAQQRIADIDAALTDLQQDLTAAQQAVDDGAAAQDQTIADYQAEPNDEHRKAMEEQAAKLIKLAEARDAVRTQIASLNLERLTLQAAIDRVDALQALRQQAAWCADHTEDLSGEVATAEVPGEIGQVIIRPGYDDAAAWSASEDGAIQPALAGTPASVFYNLAMMPGWQKWRPTYRIATITSLDPVADTCAIDIEPATSSEQGLNVNAEASYAGVPIQYMTCNAGAFEEGDRVLVRFNAQSPESPIVIGFETMPRLCAPFYDESFTFTPFNPFPPGIDSYRRLSGPSGSECSGAYIEFDDTFNPSTRYMGVIGATLDVLKDDVPIAEIQSASGAKYQVTASLDFVTTGYSATTAGNRCMTTLTTSATMEEGDPLTEVCVATLRSIVDTGNEFFCSVSGGVVDLTLVPTLYDMQSVIEIDESYTFDLQSIGIRVANTYVYAQLESDPAQIFIQAQLLGFMGNHEYGVEIDKDRRGVAYISFLFEAAPTIYSHDPADGVNVLRQLVKPMTAAFMKAPDGTIFRVQARNVAAENQVPDYASLPTAIEQDGQGNWVGI